MSHYGKKSARSRTPRESSGRRSVKTKIGKAKTSKNPRSRTSREMYVKPSLRKKTSSPSKRNQTGRGGRRRKPSTSGTSWPRGGNRTAKATSRKVATARLKDIDWDVIAKRISSAKKTRRR